MKDGKFVLERNGGGCQWGRNVSEECRESQKNVNRAGVGDVKVLPGRKVRSAISGAAMSLMGVGRRGRMYIVELVEGAVKPRSDGNDGCTARGV